MSTRFPSSKIGSVVKSAASILNTDLNSIHIEFKNASEIGAFASATDELVTLAFELQEAPQRAFDFILRHELVHIAQKRNFDRKRSTHSAAKITALLSSEIEQEADRIALAMDAGCNQTIECRLTDIPQRAAYWGELGHYYTIYYIMLSAGIDAREARIRAFFCQLPDEVLEFDATAATRDYEQPAPEGKDGGDVQLNAYARMIGKAAGIPRATPKDEFHYIQARRYIENPKTGAVSEKIVLVEDPKTRKERRQKDQDVIRGLHTLTGGDSSRETETRRKAVIANWRDPVISGLALHPYGDSFAHRVLKGESNTYGPKCGHAFHGHKPDYVSQRPSLYLQYAEDLYDLVSEQSNAPKIPFDKVIKPKLDKVLNIYEQRSSHQKGNEHEFVVRIEGKGAEEKGLKNLKHFLQLHSGFKGDYSPERHRGRHWRDFFRINKSYIQSMNIDYNERQIKLLIEQAASMWRCGHTKINLAPWFRFIK
ncbi:hypothetical protein [Roseibium album]|uniref:hypothetical protein n=1 Tax=Roseibium album TaxID=311410 RepID=UPI00248F9AFE|nr:hypothetical protein [Roseibium album]